jgi:hypothetical protein
MTLSSGSKDNVNQLINKDNSAKAQRKYNQSNEAARGGSQKRAK